MRDGIIEDVKKVRDQIGVLEGKKSATYKRFPKAQLSGTSKKPAPASGG